MQSPERVDVIPGSVKYERLDPAVNLRLFTVASPELCVLTLRLEEGISDPVQLEVPVQFFRGWIMRDTSLKKRNRRGKLILKRGRLLERQFCSESHLRHKEKQDGHFRISEVLPSQGKTVSAKVLAHLAAHLAMIHARGSSDGLLPLRFEEVTFYNPHNPRELIVVYNWPLRLDLVTAYFGVILDYLDSCVAGSPDKDFLKHLESQRLLHEQRRHWESDTK